MSLFEKAPWKVWPSATVTAVRDAIFNGGETQGGTVCASLAPPEPQLETKVVNMASTTA